MKRSNRLLILLGLIIAISGAVGAAVVANGGSGGGGGQNQAGPTASPTPTLEPTVQVVVARQDIHAGDQIKAEMVGLKPMTLSERNVYGPGTFSTVADVIGKIAGSDIGKDKAIVAGRDFVSMSGAAVEGKDLSGSVAKGMVAVSIEVDQTTGVGTLIVPGDHVDVILSVYVPTIAITGVKASQNSVLNIPGGTEVTTKMVIRNRRILATLLPPVEVPLNQPSANASPLATPAPTAAIVQFTQRHMMAIVEVMPEEAEVINWAQRAELQTPRNYIDLSLALRSRADDDTKASHTDTGGINYYQLIQNYGVLPPDPRAQIPSKLGLVIQW